MTREALLKRLRRGWLSSAQAFHEFGTIKLTSRISELRAHDPDLIEAREVKRGGKRWLEYRLAR